MDKIKENLTDLRNSAGLDIAELRHKLQQSSKLILCIVFLALLLDNILLTAVGKFSGTHFTLELLVRDSAVGGCKGNTVPACHEGGVDLWPTPTRRVA